MASATGIPATNPAAEHEPLLGRPGDAIQPPSAPVITNLWLGTGWIALAGGALLVAVIWAGVFLHPLLPLVSPHPLLQSAGLLASTLAILVLQPTWDPDTKRRGRYAHAALNGLSFLIYVSGVTVILVNKHQSSDPHPHFHSAHGYMGVVAAVLLLGQYAVGFGMWAVPAVFGGEERAKRVWKYHRWSGYVIYLFLLATVVAATYTPYNETVLDIKTWSVVVAGLLLVAGVYPRVSIDKLGIRRTAASS
ncbi:Cytochrome b ascorbate-dependent protein 3 [Coniochaeta hoffmannii]|uniref:Cytochrome b ascorbate-dependent protein 3 n=1 Tax=Coniochaeta hoffmannii TaxID=91930 RepID=A0AA38VPM5_9PEZI|nr:Cytochrome b ascorbate-dependent protein 3 [Coniochaeta hoffmannii]